MNVTLEQLCKVIQENRIKYAKILSDTQTVALYSSNAQKEYTPEDIERELMTFLKQFPGSRFTLHLKKFSTVQNHFTYSVTVPAGEGKAAPAAAPLANMEDLKKQVRDEIRAEMEADRQKEFLKEQAEQLQAQRKELETAAGKFSFIAEVLFARILGVQPGAAPSGMLQGTNTDTMKPEVVGESLTEAQKAQVNESIALLLKVMTPEELHKAAVKLNSDTKLVSLLKTYI